MTATMTIHRQSESSIEAHVLNREPSSCAINTMKTQPPPYRVKLMQSKDKALNAGMETEMKDEENRVKSKTVELLT